MKNGSKDEGKQFLGKEAQSMAAAFVSAAGKTLVVRVVWKRVQFERQPGCSWFQALGETPKTEKLNQRHKAAM